MKTHTNYFVILLTLYFSLLFSAQAISQTSDKITLQLTNVKMEAFLDAVKQQTGISILYNSRLFEDVPLQTVVANDEPVTSVLKRVLENEGFTYNVNENNIVVIVKRPTPRRPAPIVVNGVVLDESDKPLSFASVVVKGTTIGTATSDAGTFSIPVPAAQSVLQFSFMGYETIEMRADATKEMVIKMSPSVDALQDVVVTGIFERRRESFTGASVMFNKEDLRRVGNTNVLQSIKNLDPSFRLEENLLEGSNPNVMPEIRLRGQSGFPDLVGNYTSDPNVPYFVVDGFESSLKDVMDMDMNRVESVTLLKDAAAKAIYGSKAANGVVVIETVRPAAGKLRVTYNGSFNTQIPDLSSYDLCNAAEKLQVEKNAGRFDYLWNNTNDPANAQQNANQQYNYTRSYYALLDQVLQGVNTDWLAQPIHAVLGQRHSLYVEGGDNAFQYGVDVSYNNVAGVMKGSERNTFAGGVKLSYRYKSFSFRNNLTITKNRGINSPYGSFSDYASMNPYLRIHDNSGNLLSIPAEFIVGYSMSNNQRNPLFNAQLNSKDFSKYTSINNNFYIEWAPVKGFKTTGRMSLTTQDNSTELFIPSRNTQFISYTSDEDRLRRGNYTVRNGSSTNMTADINAQYSRLIANHFIFANLGWNISSMTSNAHGFVAEGFPEDDKLDNLSFAARFVANSSPSSSESTTRSIGIVGAFNYSYRDRYLFDASIRMSASSQFGSNNRWGTFWALGVGYNIHHEEFMKNVAWLDQLKLRGSIGYTGSQDFSPYQSQATYEYYPSDFYNGAGGTRLMALANPDLLWQRKMDKNIGIDMAVLNNRISARFDYYLANTKDLLTPVTVPSSTGFRSYMANMGEAQNKGFEASIRYRIWSNPAERSFLNVFVNMAHNKNKVIKISDFLKEYNTNQVRDYIAQRDANGYIQRFAEGKSMNGIWVVPSAGIDPGNGRELFITIDGLKTYQWNADDLREMGITDPTMNGSIGFNFDYKGFSLNLTGTYRFGGQAYNMTLINKVENADIRNNVDRRIFTDRWVNPGDKTPFKNIKDETTTRATSRFVEDDNSFVFAQINASYDFRNLKFTQNSGIERLRLIFDMSDIGRLSSIKIERGTSYPFAYSFSLTIQATF